MTDYALHVKYVRCVTALIKGEVGKIVKVILLLVISNTKG